jgi:hypothetical protein
MRWSFELLSIVSQFVHKRSYEQHTIREKCIVILNGNSTVSSRPTWKLIYASIWGGQYSVRSWWIEKYKEVLLCSQRRQRTCEVLSKMWIERAEGEGLLQQVSCVFVLVLSLGRLQI